MSSLRPTTNVRTNVIYNTIYEVLAIVAPLVSAPYASRVLREEALGVQSFTQATAQYFVMIAALGVSAYGAREIARQRDNITSYSRTFFEIATIIVCSTLLCLIAWGVFVACFASEHKIIYLILSLNIATVALDVSWLLRGLEEFRLIVARNSIMKVLSVVAIFVFVKSPADIDIYVLIFSLSLFLGALSLLPAIGKRLVRVPFRELRFAHHVRELMVYFLPTIATSVYLVLDKTLIGVITQSDAQNGFYSQADKIIAIAKTLVFASINTVMGVRIAYLFKQNAHEEIHQRIGSSLNYIFFLGFALMCGIMGVAPQFVPAFFGAGYEPVVPLLILFAPVLIIVGVSNCLGSHYYTPSGRRMQSTKYLIVGAIANAAMNLCLIPTLGAIGAAISTLVAETVITALYFAYCSDYMTVRLLWRSGGKKLFGGLLMFLTIRLLSLWLSNISWQDAFGKFDIWAKLVVEGIAGLLVYAATLFATRDQWSIYMFRTYVLPILNKKKKV